MRTTLLVLLGALALAGCDRKNATPTGTTHTTSADLDQSRSRSQSRSGETQASPAEATGETPDQVAERARTPDENFRSDAGRSVDTARAVLGSKRTLEPRGEERMSNVGHSALSDVDSGAR